MRDGRTVVPGSLDLIEKLKEENRRLRNALEFYADEENYNEDGASGNMVCIGPNEEIWKSDLGTIARKALEA